MISVTPKTPPDSPDGPIEMPLLPLRDMVVFPHMVAPLFVGRDKSIKALSAAMNQEKRIFLATQSRSGIDNPSEDDIHTVGTVGKVLQLLKLPDGTVKALVEGLYRAEVVRYVPHNEFFRVVLEKVVDVVGDPSEQEALIRGIQTGFAEYAEMNKNFSKDWVKNVATITDAAKLCDTIAAHFSFKIEDKQTLLAAPTLDERLAKLLELIRLEIDIFKMDQRIKKRVKEQMEKTQKSYYLNEQMRAIKKEMGAEEDVTDDLKELEEQINCLLYTSPSPRDHG